MKYNECRIVLSKGVLVATYRAKPFLPTFGNKPTRIIGREKVLDEIRTGLASVPGYPTRASLIIGVRGMGKTALLLEIEGLATEMDFVVARVASGKNMNDTIIQMIQKKGAPYIKKSRGIEGVSAGALGFSLGLSFTEETNEHYGFQVKLDLLSEELEKNGKGLMILVDEIQASGPEMRDLATAYQYLVGEGRNVALSMAGLPQAISSVLNDDVLTFLNRAYRIKLGPLPIPEIRRYYQEVLSDRNISISAPLLEQLAISSQGYPFLFQLIGFNLLNNIINTDVVDKSIVEQTVTDSVSALAESVFLPTIKNLSDGDLAFLKAMVKDDGSSRISDIAERLGVNNSYVQKYRSRLLDSGVIATPRRGQVEFTLPYLKNYLGEM